MWSPKRTAGTQLGWAGLPAVLLLFGLLSFLSLPQQVAAEDANEEAAKLRAGFDVGGAVEIEFFARRGEAYTVEGQAPFGAWMPFYGPVYGRDELVRALVANPAGFAEFRLSSEDLAPLGEAPADLEGHAYSLNYGVKMIALVFDEEGGGVAKAQDGSQREFDYQYEKASPDVGELVIEFADGGSERLTMTFFRGRVGSFLSEVPREGRRPRRASGSFRAGGDVSPRGAVAPRTLEGSQLIFRDRGMITTANFITDFSGSLSRQGGASEIISYTYDISSWPEVSLVISPIGSEETHDYTLVFNARNSGIFERRLIRGNRVRDTDRGQFSGKSKADADDDGKGGGDTKPECLAPDRLTGRTLQTTIGGQVTTILLSGSSTGSILKRRPNGRVTLQPFSYSYSKESCDEGLLTLTLPRLSGDEVQVFELDFSSGSGGSCVRKLYEGDELDETEEGNFSLSEEDGGELAGVASPAPARGIRDVQNNENGDGDDDD